MEPSMDIHERKTSGRCDNYHFHMIWNSSTTFCMYFVQYSLSRVKGQIDKHVMLQKTFSLNTLFATSATVYVNNYVVSYMLCK